LLSGLTQINFRSLMFMPPDCWGAMKDAADALSGHMNKLLELAELARHAAPEDRARLERTIELVSGALLAVTQAKEAAERARCLREEAEANLVHQQGDLISLLAELHIMRARTRK
jgi:hypothetical protein